MTPFEVVYGRNPLTPVDLTPRPMKDKESFDASNRAEFVRRLHDRTRVQLERKTARYKAQADKGRRNVQFEEGDYVWLHLRKERFPQQRKSKLDPRGDGPFRVIQKLGPNAYKLDIPHDRYGVHPSFNVSDLSLYVPQDDSDDESRTIREQMEENDSTKMPMTSKDIEDKLRVPFDGPITRARAKHIKDGTRALLVRLEATIGSTSPLPWITIITHVLEA